MKLKVVLEKSDDTLCTSLLFPHISKFDTEEAIGRIKKAIELYLELIDDVFSTITQESVVKEIIEIQNAKILTPQFLIISIKNIS